MGVLNFHKHTNNYNIEYNLVGELNEYGYICVCKLLDKLSLAKKSFFFCIAHENTVRI